MLELTALAASAVTMLAPFFLKAGEKAVETLGESAAGTLYDALKTRLQTPSAREALEDLAQTPDDAYPGFDSLAERQPDARHTDRRNRCCHFGMV